MKKFKGSKPRQQKTKKGSDVEILLEKPIIMILRIPQE